MYVGVYIYVCMHAYMHGLKYVCECMHYVSTKVCISM